MNGKKNFMKRKLLKGFICFMICGSITMGLFSQPFFEVLAVSEETQNEIDKTEEEKEQLEQELQQQEENKGSLENEKATAEEALADLKKQYQTIASELERLEEKKTEKEDEINAKSKELETAIAVQQKQYENMKKRIRHLYENSQASWISLLLQSGSIVEIINRVDDTLKIQQYDRQQLEKFTETAEEIDGQKKKLEEAKTELEKLIAEAESKQSKVVGLQQQTSASIEKYLEQIAQAEEEIGNTEEALEAKAEALQELYAKAQAEEEAERRRQAEEAAKRLQEALENGTIQPEDSGIVCGELNLTQTELAMLTAMIYCESRGEPYEGQLAVGYVIMNRVRSTKFPNSLEEVLRQHKQFEPAGSGRFDIVLTAYWQQIPGIIDQNAWDSCQQAAAACVNGESTVGESLFFRTHAPVPQLAENLETAGVPYWIIQNHIFYYSWVNY